MTLSSFDNPNSDAARQALLDRRGERLHPKRHRTIKRAKALDKKKKQKILANKASAKARRAKFLSAARAYWAGDATGHPKAITL